MEALRLDLWGAPSLQLGIEAPTFCFRFRHLLHSLRFVSRYTTILYCLFIPFALLANEVVDYLKQYQGRWVGDYTIYSAATGYSQTFPVEQRYWWEDGQLHGLSVSDTNSGMQVSQSRTYLQDGTLRSEVTQGEVTERFYGIFHDGGIVWLSTDLDRATDYQMKETIQTGESPRQLWTDGFDSYVYQDGLAHLVYRGRLVFTPEE